MLETGDKIRLLRLRNRQTLDDLARSVGVGRQAIYKYEQGTVTNIPLDNLEKLAFALGTTPSYLAGWDEDYSDNMIFSEDERRIALSYRNLSPRGQELLRERIEELKLLYGKKPESNTAESV